MGILWELLQLHCCQFVAWGAKVYTRDTSVDLKLIPLSIDPEGKYSHHMAKANIWSIYILKNQSSGRRQPRYAWLRTYPRHVRPDFDINYDRMHRWNTHTHTTIPSIEPFVRFEEKTAAVVFRCMKSHRPRFRLIVIVDSFDECLAYIDIHIGLDQDPSTLLLSNSANSLETRKHRERERFATTKIGPSETIFATTSWERIMNSEVLIIDVFTYNQGVSSNAWYTFP
jgi:hypothetical protein